MVKKFIKDIWPSNKEIENIKRIAWTRLKDIQMFHNRPIQWQKIKTGK